MKNKEEIKKVLEQIEERIDEIIDEKDLLKEFENECYEAQVACCDMEVSIVVEINKKTKEVIDVYLDTSPCGTYHFSKEGFDIYDVYTFTHKTWEDDEIWDYCIETWKEENDKDEEDDYDSEEVGKMYEEVYKQNFEYDCYRNYSLKEELQYHLFEDADQYEFNCI